MNLFGYFSHEEEKPTALVELTFVGKSPEELREVSEFLSLAADGLERNENWEHKHISDFFDSWSERSGKPRIVVFNGKYFSG